MKEKAVINDKLNSRVAYLDYLRIISTIAVIILHVAAQNWNLVDPRSYEWKIFNIYDSVVRFGVPVFAMISGALFLERENDVKRLYSKNILRIAIAFFAWSFIYYLIIGNGIKTQLYDLFIGNPFQSFLRILGGHYHMWFLPMIIGLYICVPIIEAIIKNQAVERYFLLVSLIFAFVIPTGFNLIYDFGNEELIRVTKVLDNMLNNMNVNLVLSFASYFVLGHYLHKRLQSKREVYLIYLLGAMGFISTILLEYLVAVRTGIVTQNYYGYFSLNVLLEAVAVFTLFKNLNFRQGKFYAFIVRLSNYSFGAYLVHVLIIEKLYYKWGISTLSANPIITVPALGLLVIIVSYFISMLINKIPFISKYIV